jgi:hypothetical protein
VQRALGRRNRSSRRPYRPRAERVELRGSHPAASWLKAASVRRGLGIRVHAEPRPRLSAAASCCLRRAGRRPRRNRDFAIATRRRARPLRLTETGESRTCPPRSTHREQTAHDDHERLLSSTLWWCCSPPFGCSDEPPFSLSHELGSLDLVRLRRSLGRSLPT